MWFHDRVAQEHDILFPVPSMNIFMITERCCRCCHCWLLLLVLLLVLLLLMLLLLLLFVVVRLIGENVADSLNLIRVFFFLSIQT